ncbi:MAG: Fic family protein [Xanthomonadaceae bacterium]|nr:Fic family protein [Xanthomonadaceae bacterium]
MSAFPVARPARVRPVIRVDAGPEFIDVPASLAPADGDVLGHVLFALKHEGTDLAVLAEVLPRIAAETLAAALNRTPGGKYLRLVGYLWEQFTGRRLDGIGPLSGAVVPVFDPRRYVTGPSFRCPRWRVAFNGLGSMAWCATVRRTAAIERGLADDVLARANRFAAEVDRPMLDRALSWAYLGETRASFEIEHESPPPDKARAFVDLLRHAHRRQPLSEDYLAALQSATVSNPFDRAAAFRHEQNWLSSGAAGAMGVSYLPPPPDQVAELMDGLMRFANVIARDCDPMVAAACVSFGFVFIHPFMDGNGRLSRFLFHHALCHSGRLADGLILPVSIAMAQHEAEYLAALQSFSHPARERWDVRMIDVDNYAFEFRGRPSIYRYWDATLCVEFGLRMAEAALVQGLHAQVVFARRYDRIVRRIDAEFDIRNSVLSTLVVSCLEQGRVSRRRRDQFAGAVPAEAFDAIERAAIEAMAEIDE